jgi:DNA-binding response OmpR family regulator
VIGYKILIVEDDPMLREVLVYHCTHQGLTVLEATDGRSAFAHIQNERPDLVLSDINMKGGGGLELMSRLAALPTPKPRLILMAGSEDDISENEANRYGASLLCKPFRMQELMKTIRACLDDKKSA